MMMSVLDAEATPPCFDPSKPLPIEDVKAQFLEPVKGPTKKRGLKKAAASNTVDLPLSNLNNTHHYVQGTWQHEYGQAWTKLVKYLHSISDTLARVLYDMHFYDTSEVEEVKQKGMKMSMFMPFTICNIGDVPQQRDGTFCGIMTMKFIEHLSVGISLDKVDPSKFKYYRLKLAIEGSPLYEDANIEALLEVL
ncbi:unnamed protein product [Prunus armeniaca]